MTNENLKEVNRSYTLKSEMKNVEIRKAEIITSSFENNKGENQEYSYIDIMADDEEENRIFLRDKNIDNLSKYQKGTIGTFRIWINITEGFKGKKEVLLQSFEPNKEKKTKKTE